MATPILMDEQVIEAVTLYYMEDWTQAHLAEKYSVTQPTISKCKNEDGRWTVAREELVEQLRDQGLPAAWQCLVKGAKGGDVFAAKEILNRIEGATEQAVRITDGSAREKFISYINSLGARITQAASTGESD